MPTLLTRRQMLRQSALLTAAGLVGCRRSKPQAQSSKLQAPSSKPAFDLSPADDAFLDELERASFRFFDECAHPQTGLVKDRSLADRNDEREVASIAATGFGLTALCLADERGWLPRTEARERVRRTLRYLRDQLPNEHGFFYHFVNWRTGERVWNCELSSIDTALLLAGILTCRAHFADAEISAAATAIFDRVDWRWMTNGGPLLRMGWKPESGFLEAEWNGYCEHTMLYLLAIGAGQHALPREVWRTWQRPWIEYGGHRYVSVAAPLFVHQFSHAWVDFRGQRDEFLDYFENSVTATRVHRQFCLDLRPEFPHFAEDLWGISASDAIGGYVAWGGPPRQGPLDGTLVPCAAGGSLAFLPAESLRCLRTMRERFGERVWRRYGFRDAFNPATGWLAPDVIGIDVGIALLMAENLRTGYVWHTFMANPEIRRGMQRAGFRRQ
jgi:hypothetical protein